MREVQNLVSNVGRLEEKPRVGELGPEPLPESAGVNGRGSAVVRLERNEDFTVSGPQSHAVAEGEVDS